MKLYGTSPDHVLISVFLRIFFFFFFFFFFFLVLVSFPHGIDCGETPCDWRSVYASWNTADPSGRQFPLEYGVGVILTPGSAQ